MRLLYEVNPMSMLIEQAGGEAVAGKIRALEVAPTSLHQRVGIVLGSKAEVSRIRDYYLESE